MPGRRRHHRLGICRTAHVSEGMPPKEAYQTAATRTAGPVIAATLTRIAAFSPLLARYRRRVMKYMPITLIATLVGLARRGVVLYADARRLARQGLARGA